MGRNLPITNWTTPRLDNPRKDVECVFKSPGKKLASYLEISEAISND
ncbi:MAG: hypothetical protein KAR56_04295 [Thermoplasmata archaeon]|nr:hypothetical protein [Thermoplasmata archaeon]